MGELRGLRLHTPNGPADPSASFALFGVAPVGHARFEIDHPALRQPGIERIRLGLEWAGLPPAGFAHYYAGYAPHFAARNDSFRIAVRAPALGWDAEGRQMPLFPGKAPDGPIDPVSWFDFHAEGGRTVAPNEASLSLTLVAPDDAFGHSHYAGALMAASLKAAAAQNAKRGLGGWLRELFGRKPVAPALPNPPWSPMIAKLHLSVWPERDGL